MSLEGPERTLALWGTLFVLMCGAGIGMNIPILFVIGIIGAIIVGGWYGIKKAQQFLENNPEYQSS